MLDVKFVRDNPEKVISALENRGYDPGVIDDLLNMEEQRRALLLDVEKYRQERNELSEKISRMKKEGAVVTKETEKAKGISDAIKTKEETLKELDEKTRDFLLNVPNIPHESVPIGKDETENREMRRPCAQTRSTTPRRRCLPRKTGTARPARWRTSAVAIRRARCRAR